MRLGGERVTLWCFNSCVGGDGHLCGCSFVVLGNTTNSCFVDCVHPFYVSCSLSSIGFSLYHVSDVPDDASYLRHLMNYFGLYYHSD